MFENLWKLVIRRRAWSLWGILAIPLWLASLVYRAGFAYKKRKAGEPTRVGLPVVSIGNTTVGGSGKTPLVEFISRLLLEDGVKVGIVSSGYGRENEEPILEPGYQLIERDAKVTGDEVMLLARELPEARFSIHPIKTEAAKALAATGEVDVIIVDDGFQHFSLARDLDIVAYDAAVREQLLLPFPLGILREPISALRRADVIVVTRTNLSRNLSRVQRRIDHVHAKGEMYRAQFVIEELVTRHGRLPVKYLADKSVFLFAGVGNFFSLRKQVDSLSGDLDYSLELSDHQRYDRDLLDKIKGLADEHESDIIVTTAKDWVKLGDYDFDREIGYLALTVDLDPGEERLISYIRNRLRLHGQEN